MWGKALFLNGQNKIFILYLFPLVRKNMQISCGRAAEGYRGSWWKDIHFEYNFSAVVGPPSPPSPLTVWTMSGEVTELWMYFPYWIWSRSGANVLCIQMRLFRAELNWTQMQIAVAGHFLLPFVLSVCVLKHVAKDSQPRCLAFWESKQSCPPPLI